MSMEVVSARSALLSNYEVLTLLKELESDQLARQKTALRIKKEEEERVALEGKDAAPSQASMLIPEEVSENLRTVEFEAIQYLTADYQPTHMQEPESIQKLIRDLAPYDLTKAEKLQIVNLAPTEAVELYVIVEEIEDRLGDRMSEILDIVKASLSSRPSSPLHSMGVSEGHTFDASKEGPGWDEDGDAVVDDDEFDDHGAGAGIEGDLEMGDDD